MRDRAAEEGATPSMANKGKADSKPENWSQPRLRGQALGRRRRAAQQHGRGRVQARRPRPDLPQVHLRRLRGEARRARSAEERRAPTPKTPTSTAPPASSGCRRKRAGRTCKASAPQPTIGTLVDDAMAAIERDNPSLKGVLPKDYARPGLDKQRLGQLIDLVSDIALGERGRPRQGHARPRLRILPRPVRQRRRQEAAASSTRRRCVVRVLVEMLAPYKGRVYDPCCGSGGMFVQSEKFIEAHGGKLGDISHLRPGVQLHHLAPGQDEPRHPRHRRADRATATPSTTTCTPTSRPTTSSPTRPSTTATGAASC